MYRFTRRILIVTVLLSAYCLALLVYLIPWAWIALGVGMLIAACKKGYQLSAFGSARWSDERDLRNAGMLDGNGLSVGYTEGSNSKVAGVKALFDSRVPPTDACQQLLAGFQKKRPRYRVRINKSPHLAIFAPTGVGKSTGLAIPFLLECPESCVVTDFKSELYNATAKTRGQFGDVIALDPYKLVTQTPHTFDPIDFVPNDSIFAIDDCRDIAAALVERKQETGDGIHFLDNAEAGIAAVASTVVAFGEGKNKSLQAMCEIVSNPHRWEAAIRLMCSSTIWDGMLARMSGNLMHLKDKELASSMSTIARFTRFLSTPAIAASTSKSSFDPGDLVRRTMTIYLVLPIDRMNVLSPLLRLWISSMIRAVIRNGAK